MRGVLLACVSHPTDCDLCILGLTCRLEESEVLFRQALDGRVELLGREDDSTMDSMDALAGCLLSQGRCPEAEGLYAEALALRRRVNGADHVGTCASVGPRGGTEGHAQEWCGHG